MRNYRFHLQRLFWRAVHLLIQYTGL